MCCSRRGSPPLIVLLIGSALLAGCGSQPTTSNAIAEGQRPVKAQPGQPAVSMRVELPQAAPLEFAELPHRDGMTVLEAMTSAAGRDDGLKFTTRGQGDTTFVTEIAGHAPAGEAGWIFLVNGEESGLGIGTRQLKAGDKVLWKIGTGP